MPPAFRHDTAARKVVLHGRLLARRPRHAPRRAWESFLEELCSRAERRVRRRFPTPRPIGRSWRGVHHRVGCSANVHEQITNEFMFSSVHVQFTKCCPLPSPFMNTRVQFMFSSRKKYVNTKRFWTVIVLFSCFRTDLTRPAARRQPRVLALLDAAKARRSIPR